MIHFIKNIPNNPKDSKNCLYFTETYWEKKDKKALSGQLNLILKVNQHKDNRTSTPSKSNSFYCLYSSRFLCNFKHPPLHSPHKDDLYFPPFSHTKSVV